MEYTYFIKLVPPYSTGTDREIAVQPKVYFTDNGLLTALANTSEGALLENTIANQLAQHGEIHYYAKRNGQEIDFILNNKMAFEVKETPVDSDLSTLERRAGGIGITECYLVGLQPTTANFVWAGNI